jgi:creatinine amidohydrolase
VSHLFADKTWPELQKAVEADTVLLFPVGQTEEHGLHLQVGCDTIIAERVALAVAEAVDPKIPALVLPSVPYGAVPEPVTHWPGTFKIRWSVMIDLLTDICCSAINMGFRKIVVISTHGPHGDVARLAARETYDRTGVGIVITQPHTMARAAFAKIRKSELGGASHACEYETSLMMHFGYPVDVSKVDDRDKVRLNNEWVAGDMLGGAGKVSWSTWSLQQSETGAYGDPSCATPQTGRATFQAIVEEYARFLAFFHRHEPPAP